MPVRKRVTTVASQISLLITFNGGDITGLTPDRELPIIGKIAVGSIRNKLLFILPIVLLLAAFAPVAIAPVLLLGGLYLAFEAMEDKAIPQKRDIK